MVEWLDLDRLHRNTMTLDYLVNPDAGVEPVYLALKQLHAQERIRVLSYSDVFSINEESFADHPQFLAEIVGSLEELQRTPYGQTLFRDILANEARTERVQLLGAAGEVGNIMASPVVYLPTMDSIVFDYDLYSNDMSDSVAASSGLLSLSSIILHEGDHAVRMYGAENNRRDQSVSGVMHRWAVTACWEEQAIDRANLFHLDEGLPVRTSYMLLDEQIASYASLPLEARLHGVEYLAGAEGRATMIQEVIPSIALDNGCNAPMTADELVHKAEQYVDRIALAMSSGIVTAGEAVIPISTPSSPGIVVARGSP